MPDVLSAELLEEIRRETPVAVVGGPVTNHATSTCGNADVRVRGREHGDNGNDDGDYDYGGGGSGDSVSVGAGVVPAAVGAGNGAGAAGFDEFVLCSVFPASVEEQRRTPVLAKKVY